MHHVKSLRDKVRQLKGYRFKLYENFIPRILLIILLNRNCFRDLNLIIRSVYNNIYETNSVRSLRLVEKRSQSKLPRRDYTIRLHNKTKKRLN